MNYLLDTCVISDLFKKNPTVISHFEKLSPKQIHISTVTIMEIEYGLNLNSEREIKLRHLWNHLSTQIQILPLCQQCAISTAKIRSRLKEEGKGIGPYDCLIAGTALAHDLLMVTSNFKEFNRITELKIEDWRTSPAK